MKESPLDDLKKTVEQYDTGIYGGAPTYQQLLTAHKMTHEEMQTYLLFKLLEKLQEVGSALNSIDNELWVRGPHEKQP